MRETSNFPVGFCLGEKKVFWGDWLGCPVWRGKLSISLYADLHKGDSKVAVELVRSQKGSSGDFRYLLTVLNTINSKEFSDFRRILFTATKTTNQRSMIDICQPSGTSNAHKNFTNLRFKAESDNHRYFSLEEY